MMRLYFNQEENDMEYKVKGYIACWEQPEILGSGSQEYGWEYPKTEEEALDLCYKTHRNSLQRTVFFAR